MGKSELLHHNTQEPIMFEVCSVVGVQNLNIDSGILYFLICITTVSSYFFCLFVCLFTHNAIKLNDLV